ncbi:hypothetical protein [Kalamiella sp. sgz302252]|uniref:hypothetical protein n=1 Tax=Pantoea sp. sgz302252 TaxID=3341827 RepID=UPI0036D42DC5
MNRKITFFFVTLFSLYTLVFSAAALANNQKKITGVLQAYWFPQWSDAGQAKPPLIMMRFFETDGENKKTYFLYDEKKKNEVKDFFEVTKAEKFIKSNFKNTPEEFFKFKEGHTEQAGSLVISDVKVIAECNNKKLYAKFNSFVASSVNNYDIKKMEEKSGCDPEPYSVMFTIKEGHENVFLKSEPLESSKNVLSEPVSQPLVKIKTIDSQWVKVALYDASQPDSRSHTEGYIKINDLDVAN